MTTPTFPAGRYGRRRGPRRTPRWVLPVLVVGVFAVGAAVSLQLFRQYGAPEYRPKVLGYTNVTDRAITVTFLVYKPSGEPATCFARARSADGAQVGDAEVAVPAGDPGSDSVTVTHQIATSRRPVTAEVPACTAKR